MKREGITAIVPTFNNEGVIQRCLESVKWADEILVVDSYSTDRTLDICREYGARILQHEYVNSALQKNWAIPQATHNWIFLLDTDEYLEQGLLEEMLDALKNPEPEIEGYVFCRKNLIYNEWLKTCGYYPDSLVRLFKKKYRYHPREVHAHIDIPPERTRQFEHHLIHDDFNNIHSYLTKFARYMKYECDEYWNQGRRFRWRDIIFRPLYMFLRSYIFKKGYKDGVRGLLISANIAYYNFMIFMKLWEREFYERQKEETGRNR
jgi:glycosyltransferase involved in cell wall biosynthesis